MLTSALGIFTGPRYSATLHLHVIYLSKVKFKTFFLCQKEKILVRKRKVFIFLPLLMVKAQLLFRPNFSIMWQHRRADKKWPPSVCAVSNRYWARGSVSVSWCSRWTQTPLLALRFDCVISARRLLRHLHSWPCQVDAGAPSWRAAMITPEVYHKQDVRPTCQNHMSFKGRMLSGLSCCLCANKC